jgi:ABC-type amino acid transport substrate-binding protein
MRTVSSVAMALALCSAAGAQARDLQEIKKTGRLRVVAVVEEREPEFVSLKPGGAPGFDREILEGFARIQGVGLEFVLAPNWQVLMPSLLEGKGDVVAGRVSDTAARRSKADFTSEVFPTRIVVVTRKPRGAIAGAAEMSGLRVGTIPGTSMADAVKASGFPAQKIVPLAAGQLVEALREGRVDAAVWALEGALLAQRRDPDLQIGTFLGPPESLAYGVAKGSPQLLAALNDHIALLRRTGTWNRLVVKYFGAAAPVILNQAQASR